MPPTAKNHFFESRIRSSAHSGPLNDVWGKLEEVLCEWAASPAVTSHSKSAAPSPEPAADAVSRRLNLNEDAGAGDKDIAAGGRERGCRWTVDKKAGPACSGWPKNFARVWSPQDMQKTPRQSSRRNSLSPRPDSPRNTIRKPATSGRKASKV